MTTCKTKEIVHRCGRGAAIAQYGELFQGMVDSAGALHRCLVSLPCSRLRSHSKFVPCQDGRVRVVPDTKQKSLRAAEITLELLGAPFHGGLLTIESNIPEGKGLGSSTADCIAAVASIANSLNRSLTSEQIAETVVRAEFASGNVMFSRTVLFAHREGKVLEDYVLCLPPMKVLGFDTEENRVVETLLFPPAEYSPWEIEKFRVLTAALRRAIKSQDADLLGRVATASAAINQRFLPKPLFTEMCKLVEEVQALGVAVAHSGTVAGILLDCRDARLDAKIDLLQKKMCCLGIGKLMQFRT